MGSLVRRNLSFANVMSVIAVFIALGGAAFAVTKAPKNSVTSKSIRNGQVKTVDLGGDAVTGAKLKEGTLGKVPVAASADRADRADSAATASSADVASAAGRSFASLGMNATDPYMNETVEAPRLLLTVGDVEIRARCSILSGNPSVLLSLKSATPGTMYALITEDNDNDTLADVTSQIHPALTGGDSRGLNFITVFSGSSANSDGRAILRNATQTLVVDSYVSARKPANTCDVIGTVTRAG